MKIEAKNLIKIYGDRSVVNDVSFEVNKGEVVCLLGPNGAGKTTTFYMVVGLIKPNSGCILLDNQDISAWPMNIRAKAGIGYLPQEASIFRKLSVEDNIKLVLQMNEKLTAVCDECGSEFFTNASKMSNLCPECAHYLYGYPNCRHVFKNGRCIRCGWDGSESDYIKRLKK